MRRKNARSSPTVHGTRTKRIPSELQVPKGLPAELAETSPACQPNHSTAEEHGPQFSPKGLREYKILSSSTKRPALDKIGDSQEYLESDQQVSGK